MTDTRAALLSAAILGAARGATAAGIEGVRVRTVVQAAPPRPVRPAATMPPPPVPPILGEPSAAAVDREIAALRRAWTAASPAARRAFLAGLADMNF